MRTQARAMEAFSAYMRDGTARSLNLLRDIDDTIDMLDMFRKENEAHAQAFEGILSRLAKREVVILEDEVIPAFEQAQDSLKETYALLKLRHNAALRAANLTDEDGVADAYRMMMESVLVLNSKLEQVRWAIIEHNADMDESSESKVLSDPEEIASFLRDL